MSGSSDLNSRTISSGVFFIARNPTGGSLLATTLERSDEIAVALRRRELRLLEELKLAESHPAYLLDHTQCIDAKTGEHFEFQLVDESAPWYWQRGVLDSWISSDRNLILKARQIGITWLAAGLGLWTALYKPGSRVLVVSINEDEAIKVVNRLWDMLESLPEHLRNETIVLKPARGSRPSQHIDLLHKDGRVSSIIGLPSTKKAGHGETAALVILDEYARHEYARETWKAVVPTMAGGGKVIVVSTANGISNESSGEGNFYHHLWVNAEGYNIQTQFLPWNLHPDRDDEWYSQHAMAMPAHDRAEQFPLDPEDAFINTGECWFDLQALAWYAKNKKVDPLYRFDFEPTADGKAARRVQRNRGAIRVYVEPQPDHLYALACDVATGRGQDYSAAWVIDLSDQSLVAEFHDKIDSDEYATQVHFLGQWYGTARLAVEMGGGYGEAVIIPLRDGRAGRPPYRRLYRHTIQDRPDMLEQKNWGFPINQRTRPLIINQLEAAIREKTLPWMTSDLIQECRTFCRQKTNPSPRAQDGCNDDRVMAAAIALEMFRLYGVHPKRHRARIYKQRWSNDPIPVPLP